MEHSGLSYHKESSDVIKRISDQQFLSKIHTTPVRNALVRTNHLSTSQCRGTRYSKTAEPQKYTEAGALRSSTDDSHWGPSQEAF